ncbi:hypothetical protein [Bradyrhizobium sp. HKCCYLR20261]|uniref:hypothetical protein n=1 Tax=unclassified Bradyrhizobium TaxID=2631580 RepID=UPI003EBD392A
MPTTIDRSQPARSVPVMGAAAVAVAWFAGMAAMTLLIKPEAVVVFGPSDRMIPAIVASDGALLDAGRFHVSARPGATTIGSLYAAGAWLVWPIMGKRCGRL